MILRHRRIFALLAFCLLAAPLVVGLVAPDSPATVFKEGRSLAPAPRLPLTGASWLALPAAVDAYLKDHFGLRQKLITAHRELTKPMLGFGNEFGAYRARWAHVLSRRGDGASKRRPSPSRPEGGRRNGYARAHERRASGAGNPLPGRHAAQCGRRSTRMTSRFRRQNPGKPTEYDMLLANLAAKGVTAVDLRPAVKEASTKGPAFYMHDTHWTFRGALAAYNAIVEADAHADWRIEPASALGPMTLRNGGDLARMLGSSDAVSEYAGTLTLPHAKNVLQSSDLVGDFAETSGKAGPTILILGDFFTAAFFPPMVLQHAGRVVWMSHMVLRFRLERGGKIPPRRGLVDAHGAFSGLPTWREAEGLARRQSGSAQGKAPAGLAEQMGAVRSSGWRARMSLERSPAACSCLAARAQEKAPMRRGLPRLTVQSGSISRPRRREMRKWRRALPATRPTGAKAGRRSRSPSKSPRPS